MMSSVKRKCKFTDKLKTKYPCFEKGYNDYDAKCLVCVCHVDVSNQGGCALDRHVNTEKHKKKVRASASSSKATTPLVPSASVDVKEEKVAQTSAPSASVSMKKVNAAAGTLAFHTVKHHQSYKSMDCTSSLTRLVFDDSEVAKNLKCARTKTEAIINYVIAPHAMSKISETLQHITSISVATDASNHSAEKLFPVIIQYYNWAGRGIESKILDLCSVPDETSETIADYMLKVLEKHGLSSKCVAFIGDSANVNFGGVNRNPGCNIYTLLKQNLKNDYLIGIACPAHIIHNGLHHGVDLMRIDVESVVMKIFNYFCIYTVRTEALREFCEYVEISYQPLLNHSKTRWLSLFPAIEKLLKSFPALREYFLSQNQPPYLLKTFFENPYSEAYLLFTHSLMLLFQSNITSVGHEENSVLEIMKVLESILLLLHNRIENKFVPLKVKQLVLEANGSYEEMQNIYDEFQQVYKTTLEYFEIWIRPLDEFKCFGWMVLKDYENFKYEDLIPSIEFLKKRGIIIDDVRLYDQFYNLVSFLKSEKAGMKFFADHRLHEQWSLFFKSCLNIDSFSELLKICEFYFCISAHNANVARVFSLMNAQWTKERNRLNVESLKVLIMTQYNFKDMTCVDFYSYLLRNEELLSKIGSSKKYI